MAAQRNLVPRKGAGASEQRICCCTQGKQGRKGCGLRADLGSNSGGVCEGVPETVGDVQQNRL